MKYFSLELIELIASYCQSPKDVALLSQVNHHFYSAVTRLLYKNIMINGPRQYVSFKSISKDLKRFVYRLDFSSYTTRGSRWSEEKAKSIAKGNELSHLIGECNQLKELFVGEEMMHAFVSPIVIRTIFSHQNNLSTIDFTGFCDRNFTTAMSEFFKPAIKTKLEEKKCTTVTTTIEEIPTAHWSIPKRLQNISFYMCMALSQEHFFIPFFDKLSASGNYLTRLDLAYTQISSQLFLHLPLEQYQRLTHLNLQGCHSLSCCSPLIPFIQNCTNLIELNLNMDFNGIGGSRFCHECILKILKSTSRQIQSLDMGGHTNFDDDIVMELSMSKQQGLFQHLLHLSLSYCRNLSLEMLMSHFLNYTPKLFYLNLARTPLTMELNNLPRVFNRLSCLNSVQVIEISPFTPKIYPPSINREWKLSSQVRRTYYSRNNIDPKFVYPKKMLMLNNQVLSPMNKYWCYSY